MGKDATDQPHHQHQEKHSATARWSCTPALSCARIRLLGCLPPRIVTQLTPHHIMRRVILTLHCSHPPHAHEKQVRKGRKPQSLTLHKQHFHITSFPGSRCEDPCNCHMDTNCFALGSGTNRRKPIFSLSCLFDKRFHSDVEGASDTSKLRKYQNSL